MKDDTQERKFNKRSHYKITVEGEIELNEVKHSLLNNWKTFWG